MDLNEVKQTFDYGSINEKQKETVEEVANLARQMGHHMFAEFLIHKFDVVEPKRFNVEDSKFCQLCKENDIRINLQGHVQEGLDANAIQYPVVSITEDVRKLDVFLENFKKYNI
jgi:hypothetical protein